MGTLEAGFFASRANSHLPQDAEDTAPLSAHGGPGSPLPLGGESWSELVSSSCPPSAPRVAHAARRAQAQARLVNSALSSPALLSPAPSPPPVQASANHFCGRRGGWGSGLLLSVQLPDRALPLLLAALQRELFPPSLRLPRNGPAQLPLGSLPFQWFPSVVSCSRGLGLPPRLLVLAHFCLTTWLLLPQCVSLPLLSPSPYKWLCRSAGSAGSTSNVSMVP